MEKEKLCRIVISFTFQNHLDEVNDYELTFTSLPDLKNYLRWEPEKAMQIGYGKIDEERVRKSRTSNVRLHVMVGENRFSFDTATQFANWMKVNPDVAKQLQF